MSTKMRNFYTIFVGVKYDLFASFYDKQTVQAEVNWLNFKSRSQRMEYFAAELCFLIGLFRLEAFQLKASH